MHKLGILEYTKNLSLVLTLSFLGWAQSSHSQSFELSIPTGMPQLKSASVELIDINNDGFLDPLVMGFYGNVREENDVSTLYASLFYNDEGVISDEQFPFEPHYNGDIASGDFNQDGFIDLLITGRLNEETYNTTLQKNLGNGSFKEVSTPFTHVDRKGSNFFDFDNDGDLDVLIVGNRKDDNANGLEGVCRVYENLGDEQFRLINQVFPGLTQATASVGDINGDGYVDIIHSGGNLSNGDVLTNIYTNLGNGQFSIQYQSSLEGLLRADGKLIDFDTDGDLDYLRYGTPEGTSGLFIIGYNDGNGGFEDKIRTSVFNLVDASIEVVDYDIDNDYDVIITGIDDQLISHTYTITRTGTDLDFLVNDDIASVFDGEVVAADINGDLLPDLLVAGSERTAIDTDGKTHFYTNTINASPSLTAPPTNRNSLVNNNNVRLNWDKLNFKGLSYHVEVYNEKGEIITYAICDSTVSVAAKGVSRGNAELNNFLILRDLPKGNYSWRVQCINSYLAICPHSEYSSFEITTDLPKSPFIIQSLTHFDDEYLGRTVFALRDNDMDGDMDIQFNSFNGIYILHNITISSCKCIQG